MKKHSLSWILLPRSYLAVMLLPMMGLVAFVEAINERSVDRRSLLISVVLFYQILTSSIVERKLREQPHTWEFWASLPISALGLFRARLTSTVLLAAGPPALGGFLWFCVAALRGSPTSDFGAPFVALVGVSMLRAAVVTVRAPRTMAQELGLLGATVVLWYGSLGLGWLAVCALFASGVAGLVLMYWNAAVLPVWLRGEPSYRQLAGARSFPVVGSPLTRTVWMAAYIGQLFALLQTPRAIFWLSPPSPPSFLPVAVGMALGIGISFRKAGRALASLPIPRGRILAMVCVVPGVALALAGSASALNPLSVFGATPDPLLRFSVSGESAQRRYQIVPAEFLWKVSFGQPSAIMLPNGQSVVPHAVPLWPGSHWQRYNPYETGSDPDGSAFRFQLSRALNDNFEGDWTEARVATQVLAHKEWLWALEDEHARNKPIPQLIRKPRRSYAGVGLLFLGHAVCVPLMLLVCRLWEDASRKRWLYLVFPALSVAYGMVASLLARYASVAAENKLSPSDWPELLDLTPGSVNHVLYFLDVYANQHLGFSLALAALLFALIVLWSRKAAERFPLGFD